MLIAAAPAHHFKDSTGLLMALAEDGFHRFTAMMEAEQAVSAQDAKSRLVTSAEPNMAGVIAAWSMVHGFVELLISGRMLSIRRIQDEQRRAFFDSVFRRLV